MAKVTGTKGSDNAVNYMRHCGAMLVLAELMDKQGREFIRRSKPFQAVVAIRESRRLVREVVELLASAVGLRVSAETAAKRKPSRKRARSKSAEGGTSKPAPATAQPPKKNGLPIAKPWENPGLPDVAAERP